MPERSSGWALPSGSELEGQMRWRRTAGLLKAMLRPTPGIRDGGPVGVGVQPERRGLPFAIDIPIRSYLNQAFPLSIVVADPHWRSAVFGSFIQVFFPDDKLEYDRVLMLPSLYTAEWERLGFLRSCAIDTHSRSLAEPEALVRTLIAAISRDQYVEIHVDEYFLPGRPCYQKIHSVHDNMLVGYDAAQRQFQIAGYGQDYEVTTIGFHDLLRSFYYIPRRRLLDRSMRLIRRVAAGADAFDLTATITQLEDYVTSRATITSRAMRQAPPYRMVRRFTGAWGLDTYGAFIEYVTACARARRPLDLRATRTLWEHKACMRQRLVFLHDRGHLDPGRTFARAYADIEERARAVRFAAYEYNLGGAQLRAAGEMAEGLRAMRDQERAVLTEVLSSLKSAGASHAHEPVARMSAEDVSCR